MEPSDFVDIKQLKIPPISRQRVLMIVAAVGVLILVATTWYQVGPESVGIVLRLGEYNRTTEPGLHFKIPFGIETVSVVATQRQLKEEFGFRTLTPGVRTQYAPGYFAEESLMLTGDLNVASVEWSVQYRINDPFNYLFKVRNVTRTFRYMSEAVMREIVGDRTVNEVLTVGRTELAIAAQQMLQNLCNQYEIGIHVDQVILQDITPPDPVKPSFNEVNQAQQEREQLINEARAEYNLAVPEARGEAEQQIRQAEGYSIDRVNRAQGEASRFKDVYAEYRRAPQVTRRRIYIETMNTILPKIGRKLIVDEKTQNIVPLLQLGNQGGGQ